MRLDPDRTALIVVDMQQGFCREGGSLYAERCEAVIPNVRNLLERCRDARCTVVFTQDTHEETFETEHYDEFERWGRHVVRGTPEVSIVDELEPRKPGVEEYVVEKGTYDAFFETNMNQYLRFNGIDTVLVVGVLTNVCVLHTAASAALRDYRSIIVEDCTAAITEEDEDYALQHADWLFGETAAMDDITFT